MNDELKNMIISMREDMSGHVRKHKRWGRVFIKTKLALESNDITARVKLKVKNDSTKS